MRRGKIVTCDTGRSCRFVVFEEMGGVKPTDDDVRALLEGRPSRLEWRGDRVVAVDKDARTLAGEIGPCPRCRAGVLFADERWRCRNCAFSLPPELGSRPFEVSEIATLLTKGRTPRLHGFRQKTGAVFKAAVVLNEDGRLQWDYKKGDDETGDAKTCPVCVLRAETHPGHVIRGRTAFGCSRWKEGCGLRVPFEVKGKTLDQAEIDRLLSRHKATRYLKGFDGLKRSARLVLTEDPPHWRLEERTSKRKQPPKE